MRINAISSIFGADYNKKSFKGLIKDKTAIPVIKTMSKSDKIEFKRIKKRLSKTKYWDLKISTIGNILDEFKFHFINKTGTHGTITEGIYPYDRQGKTIKIYSIVYEPENASNNTVETLKFKTEKRAKELFNKYQENVLYAANRGYNITPVESLKMKEVELRMLEEGAISSGKKHSIKNLTNDGLTKQLIGNDLSID